MSVAILAQDCGSSVRGGWKLCDDKLDVRKLPVIHIWLVVWNIFYFPIYWE